MKGLPSQHPEQEDSAAISSELLVAHTPGNMAAEQHRKTSSEIPPTLCSHPFSRAASLSPSRSSDLLLLVKDIFIKRGCLEHLTVCHFWQVMLQKCRKATKGILLPASSLSSSLSSFLILFHVNSHKKFAAATSRHLLFSHSASALELQPYPHTFTCSVQKPFGWGITYASECPSHWESVHWSISSHTASSESSGMYQCDTGSS